MQQAPGTDRGRCGGRDGAGRTTAASCAGAAERRPSSVVRNMRCWRGWCARGTCPARWRGICLTHSRAWVPLRGTRLFGVEPVGGGQDVEGVLRAMWSRLTYEADQATWQDKVVLVEVAGQIGLALAALLTGEDGPRSAAAQAEVPRPRDGCTRGGGV